MADANGAPTDELLKTYRNPSAGGAGAIINDYASVKQDGRTFPTMRMFDSSALPPIRRDAIMVKSGRDNAIVNNPV